MKHVCGRDVCQVDDQPPSGGCVLKPRVDGKIQIESNQPPSGGCVLKQQALTDW